MEVALGAFEVVKEEALIPAREALSAFIPISNEYTLQPAVLYEQAVNYVPALTQISATTLDFTRNVCTAVLPEEYVATLDEFATTGHEYTKGYPLMNPYHLLFMMGAYLTMVFVLPILMKPIPAFKLKWFSRLHNLCLTVVSLYMVSNILFQALVRLKYNLFGNPMDNVNGQEVWALFYVHLSCRGSVV
jgi:GNS1/SUR4 family protein